MIKELKIFDKAYINMDKSKEIIEFILVALFALLTPLVIPKTIYNINTQYLIGTLVNASLVVAGINLAGKEKILAIVTLPSISAMCSGVLFKTASIYTVYMIPFIWIGNFLLVYILRKMYVSKNKNIIYSGILGILLKVITIYLGFRLLYLFKVIPTGKIFTVLNQAMGLNQLITAVLGTILGTVIVKKISSIQKIN